MFFLCVLFHKMERERRWSFAMERKKLTCTFHNPNSVENMRDFLIKVLVKVNQPELEASIRSSQAAFRNT